MSGEQTWPMIAAGVVVAGVADPVSKEKHMAPVPFNYIDNIFIHDNPVAYRREVVRYLDLIRTTGAGRRRSRR